jgi:hypothetical protein
MDEELKHARKETSMKITTFLAFMFAAALSATTATAQPAPFNDVGVTMGHWHLASKDLEANKKIFLAMGGKLYMPGGAPLIVFPGLHINLNLGNASGRRRFTRLGGEPCRLHRRQRAAARRAVEGSRREGAAGGNGRLDQAYVETPDGTAH